MKKKPVANKWNVSGKKIAQPRNPKHLSNLTVEDILNAPTNVAGASGKNYIMLESIANTPGAVMMGRERELKQALELAEEMGIKNIAFFPADAENKFARLENTDNARDEIFED